MTSVHTDMSMLYFSHNISLEI